MRTLKHRLMVAGLGLGLSSGAFADNDCSFKSLTLRGNYVFAATGYNIVSGVPQPKAIIEVITFNGDGTLTVPAVTVSINGTIVKTPAPGTYTIDTSCAGTIAFQSGQTFDIYVASKGDKVWMIQTNPNTALQGTATRSN